MIIHNKKARDSVEFTIFKFDQPIPESYKHSVTYIFPLTHGVTLYFLLTFQ